METRSHHSLFKLTFFILLVANLFLGYLLLKVSKAASARDDSIHRDMTDQSLQFAYQSFFACQPEMIENMLFERDLTDLLAIHNESLFLFIPSDPCEACLNYQLGLLKDEYPINAGKDFSIIVPVNRKRQILAKLGSFAKNVHIREYDTEHSISGDINYFGEGQLIYFTISNHLIEHTYMVNKAFGEATRLYLQYL